MIRLPTGFLVTLTCSALGHLALFLYFGGSHESAQYRVQFNEQLSSVRVEIVSQATPAPPKPSPPIPRQPEIRPILVAHESPVKPQMVKKQPSPSIAEPQSLVAPLPEKPLPEPSLEELPPFPDPTSEPPSQQTSQAIPESPANEQTTRETNGAFQQQKAKAIHCPSPIYPRSARERKMEGQVVMQVTVEADGSIGNIQIKQSSGHRLLDRSAMKTIRRKWKFTPSRQGTDTHRSVIEVEIRFSLKN